MQLYLWCTAGFFLLNAYAPVVRLDPQRGVITSSLTTVSIGWQLPPEELARLTGQGVSLQAFARTFDGVVGATLPVLLFGLVVATALLMALLHRGDPFLRHAVLALHWAAFDFVLEALRQALPLHGAWAGPISMGLTLVALLFLSVALRRVYGRGWPGSVLRAVLTIVAFSGLLALWIWSAGELAVRWAA